MDMKKFVATINAWFITTLVLAQVTWLLVVSWQPLGRLLTTADILGVVGLCALVAAGVVWKGTQSRWLSFGTQLVATLWFWQIVLLLWPVFPNFLTPFIFMVVIVSRIWGRQWKYNPFNHPLWERSEWTSWLVIAGIAWFVSASYFIRSCEFSVQYEFDAQNFLTWEYTALAGYMPYRDVFYWYGLLMYFLPASYILQTGLALWSTALLVGVYGLLNVTLKQSKTKYWAFTLLLILIDQFVGYHSFLRYGTGLIITAWTALAWFQITKRWQKPFWLGLGIITGSLFFLIQDQGLYVGLVLTGLFGANVITASSEWRRFSFWKDLVTQGGWLLGGITIAALPFVLWLMSQGGWSGYLTNLGLVGQMNSFAKVPYFGQYLLTMNMIVTVSIGLLILDLWYRFLFHQSSLREPKQFLKIALLGIILLFQYKSVVRPSIANQFMFIPWVVLWIYLSDLKILLTKYSKISWLNELMIVTLSVMGILLVITPTQLTNGVRGFWHHLSADMSRTLSPKQRHLRQQSCLNTSFEALLEQAPPEYQQTVRWLESQPDFSGQIFSYPADPVFYILLHQMPAPYFNTYDATSETAQKLNVAFMQKPEIQYVVLNVQDTMTQDGVPNVLRNQRINEYLYTHFQPVVAFGKFVILRKSPQPYDALLHSLLTRQADFIQSQLELNMLRLPFLENHYFSTQVTDQSPLLTATSAAEVATWFTQTSLSPSQLWVEIAPESAEPQFVTISFITPELVKTSLTMKSCSQTTPCLLNLSRVPLFFWSERKVTFVQVETEQNTGWKLRLYPHPTSLNTTD